MDYTTEKERIYNKILFVDYQLGILQKHKWLHRKKIRNLNKVKAYYTQYIAFLEEKEGK